jgi:spore coat polysaccharide biosynthesis protein SpsF
MNIIAFVQARLGSSRLPGKALREIQGKPMIWHVIDRLKHSKHISKIVVATTINPLDEKIAAFCEQNNVGYHRGSEMDLVSRFYETAKKFNADIIVRIWGDCVMIDPQIVDKGIAMLLDGKLDYVSNVRPPSFPRGMDFEVFTFAALERDFKETSDPFYREYMTDYIFRNPDKFKLGNLANDTDMSSRCLYVDYADDLALAQEIYKEMHAQGKTMFYLQDILDLLEQNPRLKQMNAGLQRYSDYLAALKKKGISAMGWENAGKKNQ